LVFGSSDGNLPPSSPQKVEEKVVIIIKGTFKNFSKNFQKGDSL